MKRSQNVQTDRGTAPLGLGGAAVGAAVGGAVGGIPGAIVGGMAGYNELNKLTKSFEKHVQQGGSLPFEEFVMSLAKGGIKAGVTAASIGPLQEAATNYLSSKAQSEGGGETPPDQGPTEGQAPTPEQVGSEQEVTEQPLVPVEGVDPNEAKASYDVLIKSGVGTVLESVKQDLSPMEAMQFTRKMFGANAVKDIERARKKPFEQVYEEFKQHSQIEQPQRAPEQELEEVEEIETVEQPQQESELIEQVEEEPSPQISRQENPTGWSFEQLIGDKPESKDGTIKGKARPFASSLKSSNISAATYDADKGKMRVVFKGREGRKGGDVYEYENFDLDTFNKMTSGEAKPITEGSNKFGVWFNTKKPSIGATFNKEIKKNKELFPYKKVEPKGHSVEESTIIEADRTHLASELFAPFAGKRLEGRQKSRAQGLKDIEPSLKNMDDAFLFDTVVYLENKLKSKLKTEPTVKRLSKEYKKEFMK